MLPLVLTVPVSGREPKLGTLEMGKLADLVVVDGSPLWDGSARSRVETLVKGGAVVVEQESRN